jgi:hypothetical protein
VGGKAYFYDDLSDDGTRELIKECQRLNCETGDCGGINDDQFMDFAKSNGRKPEAMLITSYGLTPMSCFITQTSRVC